MVQKQAIIFEKIKDERTYQFIIPVGAPIGEVFDVIFEMLGAAEELSKQAFENAKKAMEEARAKQESTEANNVNVDAVPTQEVEAALN